MIKLKSIKLQLIIFLLLFALYISLKGSGLNFLISIFISSLFAALAEILWLYPKDKKIVVTESSIITGLIVGYVLYSRPPWLMPIVASLIAVSSKYILRLKGKHIFNPAAFGIFAVILLFGAPTLWKGTYLWYILAPFGVYFSYKIRKLELLAGYFLTAFMLFGLQAHFQGVNLLDIFGYLSYFYIFIMLIEPKTTPIKPIGKILFGMSAAVFIFALTEIGVSFDVELAVLLSLNLFTPLLNKLSS